MRLRGGAAAAVVLVFAVAGCKADTTTGSGGPEGRATRTARALRRVAQVFVQFKSGVVSCAY